MNLHGAAASVVFVTLAAAAPIAHSQTYPAKPVRLVVGFPPGGATDIGARIVATGLGDVWGTNVLVENRPGAGSSIAAGAVAKASPDGYTLFVCTVASHSIVPATYKKLPYDPISDFTPVSQIGTSASVLLVQSSAPTKSLGEFIGDAKRRPGKLSVASPGNGTSQHMALELLKSMAGIDVVHVPYKGGAPALAELLGGQVHAMMGNLPTYVSHIKTGRVRALGVTSPKRHWEFPEIPTIAEAGVPGYEVLSWFGICAPSGLPKPLLLKINGDLVNMLSTPDTQQRLRDQGFDVASMAPDQFASHIRSEIAKWKAVVKTAGIAVE